MSDEFEYITSDGVVIPAAFANEGDYIIASDHVSAEDIQGYAVRMLVECSYTLHEAESIANGAYIFQTFGWWRVHNSGEINFCLQGNYEDIPVTVLELW